MPVRRGHVAPRTTIIETIIRKFDTHSKFTLNNYINPSKYLANLLLTSGEITYLLCGLFVCMIYYLARVPERRVVTLCWKNGQFLPEVNVAH